MNRHHEAEAIDDATESVCPVCLQRISARRIAEGRDVYLVKTCPGHGSFRTIIWRGEPDYQAWGTGKRTPSRPPVCATARNEGCPFDCGLCPEHRQHTCCVVMEVTQRCNLSCPFCFASAPKHQSDPDLETIADWCRSLLDAGGPFNLQLSGGEPTVREDVPDIISLARGLGFPFVQLNTNGIRLATQSGYAHELKRAGLGCVFLQFDGLTDEVYQRMRGRRLLDLKLAAIRACGESEIGVVLVPTLVPGVNIAQIGEVLQFAIDHMPTVRAVHFQPVSYFGRFPKTPTDKDRITIPEVLCEIELQTRGRIPAAAFYPPSAENPYCSFQGKFVVQPDGSIRPSAKPQTAACCGAGSELVQLGAGEAARRSQKSVARQWCFPQPRQAVQEPGLDTQSLDEFLAGQQNVLSISGMAFQDAWNLDLDRLRDCFLNALGAGGRLIPLCSYNLTSSNGRALYRGVERV